MRNCHNLPIQEVLDKCLEYGTEAILFTGSHDECSKFRRLCPSSFTVDATQFFSRDPMLDRHEKQRVNKHKTSFTHNVTYESFKTEEIADITRYLDDAFRAPRPAQIMNLKIEKTPFVSDIHCLAGLHRSQAAARSFGLKLMASGASVCVINYGMFHRWWCDKDYCVLLGFPQEPPLQKLGQWAKGPPGHTKPSKAAESPDLRAASAAGSTDRRAVIERTEKPKAGETPGLPAQDLSDLQKIILEACNGSAQVQVPDGIPLATWSKFKEANAQRIRRTCRRFLKTQIMPDILELDVAQCKLLIDNLGLRDGHLCNWLCYSGCGRLVVSDVADPPSIPKFCCLQCMSTRAGTIKHARHCECKCGPGRRQPRMETSFQAKSLQLMATNVDSGEADFDDKEQTDAWLFETAQEDHWNAAVIAKREDLLKEALGERKSELHKIDERLVHRGEAGGLVQQREEVGNPRVQAALAQGKPSSMKPMIDFLSKAGTCKQLFGLHLQIQGAERSTQHPATDAEPALGHASSPARASSETRATPAASASQARNEQGQTRHASPSRSHSSQAPAAMPSAEQSASLEDAHRSASGAPGQDAQTPFAKDSAPSFDAPPKESPKSIAFAACGIVRVDAADCPDSHTFNVQTAFDLYVRRSAELTDIAVEMGNVYGVFVFHFFDTAARDAFQALCHHRLPHQGLSKLYSTERDAECVKFSTLANSALRLAVAHGADWTALLSLRDAFSAIPLPNDALDEVFDHHNTSNVVLYLPGGGFGCRLATWSWAWHQSGYLEEQYRNAPTLRVQCELLARNHGMHVQVLKDSGDPGIGYAPAPPGRCCCIDGEQLSELNAKDAIASLGMDFEEECLEDLELMHRDLQRLEKTPRNNVMSPAQGFHTRRMISSDSPHCRFSGTATIEPLWIDDDAVMKASHPCTYLWKFLHERHIVPFNAPVHTAIYERNVANLMETRPAKRQVRVAVRNATGQQVGTKKLRVNDPSVAAAALSDIKLAKGTTRKIRKERVHERKLLEEAVRTLHLADPSVMAPERMQ